MRIPTFRNVSEQRAFTVTELLVVIGIVALLSAILFPVLARAKAAAQVTTCMSNLRQIGLGTTLYAGDNGDFLMPRSQSAADPPVAEWTERLKSYGVSSRVLRCPADCYYDISSGSRDCSNNFHKRTGSSYSYNGRNIEEKFSTLTSAPDSSKTALMIEHLPFHDDINFATGRIRTLFFDLHVAPVPWGQRMQVLDPQN